VSSSRRILGQILDLLLKSFSSGTPRTPKTEPGRPGASGPGARLREEDTDAGNTPESETVRIDPGGIRDLRVEYSPSKDGAPDAGEVIWTWVPYEENDGRGKDRPVLVIGRQSAERVYAVRMTIGGGGWDSQGRESWVDIEQLYSVHDSGMRREAAILDRSRYERVADALMARYGWAKAR
jgi:hypothetical protein